MNRRMKKGVIWGLVAGGLCAAGSGCLSRPVDHADPKLDKNFTSDVRSKAIDKVDILFDIDNSASMGDKQEYLKAAIADLVNRLVNPSCIDPTNKAPRGHSNAGDCSAFPGTQAEFQAVHDMHLGVISSSLGGRGGNVCPQATAPAPFGNVQAHNDDGAHLLNRSLTFSAGNTAVTEGVVADAPAGDPYLYWYPAGPNAGMTPGPGQPITSGNAFIQDFTDLVGGTGVFGCGIESQLESWYRFLIQPDPYASIVNSGGRASWQGVDTQILQERHDFLRPDSLVAIIVLSDENDSEVDVRSLGGQGVNWMSSDWTPPKGTSACASAPGSPACQSCAQENNRNTDPSCMAPGGAVAQYTALNDWGRDINLRHVHMRAKYGVDVQYPIDRYVLGLTSTTVPDRDGEYPPGASSYVGTPDCQNPLYAAQLPDGSRTDKTALCHAAPGTQRTKNLVFFAHIGGVPYPLLHFAPGNATASTLTSEDWVKILGKDPEGLDYTGIDPHMIEDYKPRANLPPPGSAPHADAINGHEWITDTGTGRIMPVDREYACTFDLVDANGRPAPRDCTQSSNSGFCDCPHTAGSLTADEVPPICDPQTITKQTGAKAYPTIRELLLAKKMGKQGIVSSICPQHVAEQTPGDPLYGYRPAVAVIVDRLKRALTNQCLPQTLQISSGVVPCLILLRMPPENGGTCLNPHCDPTLGLSVPDSQVLSNLCTSPGDQDDGGSAGGAGAPANVSVCALKQLTSAANPGDFMAGSCANAPDRGWCYVTGEAAGDQCSQAIVFSPKALPSGATALLQCVEQSDGVTAR